MAEPEVNELSDEASEWAALWYGTPDQLLDVLESLVLRAENLTVALRSASLTRSEVSARLAGPPAPFLRLLKGGTPPET